MMLRKEFIDEIVKAVEDLVPGMSVKAMECVKNNDIIRNGIVIRKDNEPVSPTIYIENYVENDNTDFANVNKIAKQIVDTYYNNVNNAIDLSNVTDILKDFQKVKPLLRIRLINKENNRKLLETVPYMPFLDMAIIAIVELASDNNGSATIKVTHDLLKSWNFLSFASLFEIAKENTFNQPYVLHDMADILAELSGMPREYFDDTSIKMYVLSNQNNINGATEICKWATMRKIAEKLHSDLIVIPSSIHEVIIVKKDGDMDLEDITRMVKDINGSEVSPEEVLSDHAYVFSRENGWDD